VVLKQHWEEQKRYGIKNGNGVAIVYHYICKSQHVFQRWSHDAALEIK